MTLSEMENKDDVFEALKSLSGDNNMFIPPVLDTYLKKVAKTGKTNHIWENVKPLVLKKFQIICEDYLINGYPEQTNNIRSSIEEIDRLKDMIQKKLNDFENIPFTIQRLSELLTDPKANYSRIDKYLRGLEKVVLVVSTVDQYGNKICDASNHTYSEYSDNGSLNESSELVTSDRCDLNDDNHESIGDVYSLREGMDDIETRKMDLPGLVDSPVTWKSKSFNYAAIHRSELLQSPTKSFHNEPTENSETEGGEVDLRPIGRLEAFVQNVGINSSPTSTTSTSAASEFQKSPSKDDYATSEKNKVHDEEMNAPESELSNNDLNKTEPMEELEDGTNQSASSLDDRESCVSSSDECRKRVHSQEDAAEILESPLKLSRIEDESVEDAVFESPTKMENSPLKEKSDQPSIDLPKEAEEPVETNQAENLSFEKAEEAPEISEEAVTQNEIEKDS